MVEHIRGIAGECDLIDQLAARLGSRHRIADTLPEAAGELHAAYSWHMRAAYDSGGYRPRRCPARRFADPAYRQQFVTVTYWPYLVGPVTFPDRPAAERIPEGRNGIRTGRATPKRSRLALVLSPKHLPPTGRVDNADHDMPAD